MIQRAYDLDNPNGASRRTQGDRVVMIFRLYQRQRATSLPSLTGNGPLDVIQSGLRTAREFLRENILAPLGQGMILVKEYRFVLILEGLEIQREARAAIHYTRDGVYVDMPMTNALGYAHIRIAGRTHWSPVLVNGVPVDGDAALKDFQEMIDDFFSPGPRGGAPADYELRWYNLTAPISSQDPFGEFEWVIQPKGPPAVRQSAPRPFQRSFEFAAYGLRSNRDVAKAEDGFLEGLWERGPLKALLDLVPGGSELADGLDAVFGTIDEFQGLLDDVSNIVTAATDYITGVRQFIEFSFAKVRGLISSVDEIIGKIEEGIDLVADIGDLTEEQIDLLKQTYPGFDTGAIDAGTGQHVTTQNATQLGMLSCRQQRQLRDFLLSLSSQPRAFSPLLSASPAQQTVAVTISENITLEQLAAQNGVSASDLIDLNQLRYPFVDARERPDARLARLLAERTALVERDGARISAGQEPLYTVQLAALGQSIADAEEEATLNPVVPGVLYAHDTIRVPRPSSHVAPSIIGSEGNFLFADGSFANEEERIFGIDLLLDRKGDLLWDDTAHDVALSRGLENIQRVQERYLRLPLGALRFAPSIGNYAYADLSRWQTPGENYLLAYSLFRTLSQDPRVRVVRNMRVVTHAGVAALTYSLELINGQDLPELRVPIGEIANV